MSTATQEYPNDNGVLDEASTHENSSKQHSHICRNCGATFTPQKGVSIVGIGIVLIIIPFILYVVFGIDLPKLMVSVPSGVGVLLILASCDTHKPNNVVCPHCGNEDGNVGLLTPMGQKLYKDLHEKQV
ncbi:MAG: hypothetical protein J6R18_10155 [Kiritimatiellae bacterium]|nr:hypothetical protein [Kiritimatiellia bacterium]